MNELYEKLLRETYELVGQGDIPTFITYLDDDISWTETAGFPYAGTYIGPVAVIENVHQRLGSEWHNFTAKDKSYGFNNNQVYVYGQYSGEYKVTSKSFVADFVHIYEFNQENKIQKFTQVVDSQLVNDAMK